MTTIPYIEEQVHSLYSGDRVRIWDRTEKKPPPRYRVDTLSNGMWKPLLDEATGQPIFYSSVDDALVGVEEAIAQLPPLGE